MPVTEMHALEWQIPCHLSLLQETCFHFVQWLFTPHSLRFPSGQEKLYSLEGRCTWSADHLLWKLNTQFGLLPGIKAGILLTW